MSLHRLTVSVAFFMAAFCATTTWAQGVARPESHADGILLVVTDKSGLVSNDSPLYLASNLVGWNPGDRSMKLSGRSDLRWQILLTGPDGGAVGETPLAFKFTRGSWETCEVAADLADIGNRTLEPMESGWFTPGKPVVIEMVIERFADEREGAAAPKFRDDTTRPLNTTGNAMRVQVIGGAGAAAGAMRDVIVWLPPGYDDPANAERRYPVLYMQDGQNVFDHRPPTPGEWGADETATRLIEAGEIEPIVIVAIPHSAVNRAAEYLPGSDSAAAELAAAGAALGVTPDGDAYLNWLVREVVPRVERAVRASANPADRGIGGSSLGGLITLRAAQQHPGSFGRYLCESPALWIKGRDLSGALAEGAEAGRLRVFIGIGGEGRAVQSARALAQALGKGDEDGEVSLLIQPEAAHDEHAWAARFPAALKHLYGTEGE